MIRLWPVVVCVALGACYQPSLGDCLVTCEAATGCPTGLTCGGNGYCHPAGEPEAACGAVVDAAIPDAGLDGDDPDGTPTAASLHGLAAGAWFTCGIDPDDRLWCWGHNGDGQLGIGVTSLREPAPRLVDDVVATWSAVTTTARSACGIDAVGGGVYCWGANGRGQLGRGAGVGGTFNQPAAVAPVTSPGAWSSLSGWSEHVCGINAGRVFCWGRGGEGQLGNGGNNDSDVPARAGTDADWVQVAVGFHHTCGIRDESGARTLYCWGGPDGLGQTPAATGNVTAPGAITAHPTGKDWFAVAAGFENTCAIDEDRDLWCWGHNGQGIVLTSANAGVVATPTLVDAVESWDQVSIGYAHACARAGAAVRCWGDSDEGQAGVHPSTPGMHAVAGSWTEVTTATEGHHSCAAGPDGASCWGYNKSGQLGTGVAGDALVPAQVVVAAEPDKQWRTVVAGEEVTCAIAESDGAIWCWGYDGGILLGLDDQRRPARLDALGDGWAAIDAEFAYACAIKAADASLWCWGLNASGQLGNGGSGAAAEVTGGGAWLDVGVGRDATCAIKEGGTLWCWGSDSDGVLGDPSGTTSQPAPRQVSAVADGWIDVSVGDSHACAVRGDGSAACWGYNLDYAVDDQDLDTVIQAPVDLPGTGWSAIEAASSSNPHSTGRIGNARLAWGNAFYGRLGLDLGPAQISPPASLAGEVANWTAVTNGGAHGCGLRDGGQLWGWGYAVNAPTGNGTYDGSYTPVRIGSAAGWREVSSGTFHNCAIDADRHLWCWGQNHALQLGSGLGMSAAPVPVVLPP